MVFGSSIMVFKFYHKDTKVTKKILRLKLCVLSVLVVEMIFNYNPQGISFRQVLRQSFQIDPGFFPKARLR